MKRYLLIKNIGRLVTMTERGDGELGVIKNAVCVIKQGKIEWIGESKDSLPIEEYMAQVIDAEGKTVMPGLIDCHTHLVHGGSRQDEVAERARGISYEEIAKRGGGILSTVRATRGASAEDLLSSARERADIALSKGITTMEVKSGYGLDVETEIKMLQVVDKLENCHYISFVPTFLGAHTIPAEYENNREKYVDIVVNEMIPRVAEASLAKFCDVFVEKIAFTVDEGRKILEAGKRHGLLPKLHADQLGPSQGAELAAEVGAVSADHLEYVSDKGVAVLKEAGVIAVMIPGSTFYLGRKDFAPARKLLDAGITTAIATDYNPGSSPSLDLFLTATMAIGYQKMTMEECLKGITVNAAKALRLEDGRGEVREGGAADILVLDCSDEYFPIYNYASDHVKYVIKKGRLVFEN